MKQSSNDIVRLNIKYYRLLNKVTQRKLAEVLGVDEKHYCSLEAGRYNFTLPNIDMISDFLHVEPWILFKEKHTIDEIKQLK